MDGRQHKVRERASYTRSRTAVDTLVPLGSACERDFASCKLHA